MGKSSISRSIREFWFEKFNEYVNANPEQKQYFQEREKDAELNAKYQIYSSLVKGGMFTTNTEGKIKYEMEANKVTFDYVSVLYSSVKDTDIKVTSRLYWLHEQT